MATPKRVGVSVLRTLHRIHRQLADLNERFARGPKQIRAAEANVQHQEELLQQAKAESKALRLAADQKQLLLKSAEDKMLDLQRKLNTATSNREYQSFKEQIAAAEMANSVMADEILESFEKSDAFQKNIAEAESALAAAKQKLEQIHAEVAEREPGLKADIARVDAELQKTETELPDDIRELYGRITRQKGEDGLAAVENQYCSGCNQQIPLNLCNLVMLGQPIFCKSCGRLLYIPE